MNAVAIYMLVKCCLNTNIASSNLIYCPELFIKKHLLDVSQCLQVQFVCLKETQQENGHCFITRCCNEYFPFIFSYLFCNNYTVH